MSSNLKAYIIEDNKMSLEILKELLNKYFPNITVIGEANNEKELIELLLNNSADIIFLDIELGGQKTSLDILKEFENIKADIIITSSSKEYALKVLNEYNVTSYLIKPLDVLSLRKAILNLNNKLDDKFKIRQLEEAGKTSEQVLALPGINKIEIININHILYVEADGKYSRFFFEDGTEKFVSKNIGIYQSILPPNMFFRIHHKYILNITKIDSIHKNDGLYCHIKGGKNLPIAKRRIIEFRNFLNLE